MHCLAVISRRHFIEHERKLWLEEERRNVWAFFHSSVKQPIHPVKENSKGSNNYECPWQRMNLSAFKGDVAWKGSVCSKQNTNWAWWWRKIRICSYTGESHNGNLIVILTREIWNHHLFTLDACVTHSSCLLQNSEHSFTPVDALGVLGNSIHFH